MSAPTRPCLYSTGVMERLLSHVEPEPNTGCWLWTGYVDPKQYAYTNVAGKTRRAARVFYEAFREAIPQGLTVDHKCRVRSCVNPWHLEAVTNKVNLSRGFGVGVLASRQTTCVNGHPFDGRDKRGWRVCKECHNARRRVGLRALALLLILLAAPFASAGEHKKLDLATPILIHGGAQAFDHFSTQAALARGGREVGPIASKTGPQTARLIGGAVFMGADVLAQRKGPRWLPWLVRGASVAVGVYAFERNRRVGR